MSTELIPVGKYKARAKSWDLGTTDTGKEQIAVLFDLLSPGYEGRSIPWYGYFTDAALQFTVETMRACGWRGIDLDSLDGLDANEVNLTIEHDTYNGVTRARVKWVNNGGALLKNKLEGQARKEFAHRMRGAIAGLRPQAESNTKQSPTSDEGMPF